ncbi:MAG: hypothetical protein AB1486_33630 [Planctomycetota bacterium]
MPPGFTLGLVTPAPIRVWCTVFLGNGGTTSAPTVKPLEPFSPPGIPQYLQASGRLIVIPMTRRATRIPPALGFSRGPYR